jgi:hypothetical protein
MSGNPCHLIYFGIVPGGVSTREFHGEKINPLEDSHQLPARLVSPRKDIRNVAEGLDVSDFEAGFLAHLAHGRYFHAFAFFDVPFGQCPGLRALWPDERELEFVGRQMPIYEAAG